MSHATYCSMGMSSSAGGSPKPGFRRSLVRIRWRPMTPSTLSRLKCRSLLASSNPPLSTVMVIGSRETTALDPSGVFSSTSTWMARSPMPTFSASSPTIAAISAASYLTSWNSSGETVMSLTASGALAVDSRLRFAERARSGDATRLDHECLELASSHGRPFDLRRRSDERLQHHLAVPPVVHLVLEDELQPADGGGVGDRARGVEVERVRRHFVGDPHPVDADQLLDGLARRLRRGHRLHELHHGVVRRLGEAVGVHLAELRKALVPEVGVPRVLVAVRAETDLDVHLGDGRHPSAEGLEEAHLHPLVVADAASRLLHAEQPRQLTPVPRSERRARHGGVRHVRHVRGS